MRKLEMESRTGVMGNILGLFSADGQIEEEDLLEIHAKYAISTLDYYVEALNVVDELRLEITNKEVSELVEQLRNQLELEYSKHVPGVFENPRGWIKSFDSHQMPSDEVQDLLISLISSANSNLHWDGDLEQVNARDLKENRMRDKWRTWSRRVMRADT